MNTTDLQTNKAFCHVIGNMEDMGYNDALKSREELRLPMLRGKILSLTCRFYPPTEEKPLPHR